MERSDLSQEFLFSLLLFLVAWKQYDPLEKKLPPVVLDLSLQLQESDLGNLR